MTLPLRLLLVPVLMALPAMLIAQAPTVTKRQLRALHFRQPGPAVMGGRIHDIESLPERPAVIYVATATGGLWKTINKGTTWTPIFDDQPVSTFGDIAIAPSDPSVLWAGTGGQNNRQSSSWGNGVYRSTDAGSTWVHAGLDGTRHIGRILVHPDQPEVAWVAALGNLWAPSPERGVFKTTDGGATWARVLFVDTLTGAVDLAMDPNDPEVLYAATYQRQRRAWGFNGGGPGSGIYRTRDGGATWTRLGGGLPEGDLGRIGLAASATTSGVLNAIIEHRNAGGVYRTQDGGEHWERMSGFDPRPMYYSHIYLDPTDDNRIYSLATQFSASNDGGRHFHRLPTNPTYDVGVHSDFHALWIDPGNAEHLYLGGDGGFWESWDRGSTYRKINNLPIGQFYAIGVDHQTPYTIFGGLQDNHSWMGPSETRHWTGIINDDWQQIGFGDGMYHQPDPLDPRYEYGAGQGGSIVRLDRRTGDLRSIRPQPAPGDPPYRFDWTAPILLSQHDPAVVYLGGNRLFISRDRGNSWERTEDLTRQIDRDTLTIMGVPGSDITLSRNDGTSSFGELTTIAESPLSPDILWVGTDDGNVQISRDGGGSWRNVSERIPGVPRGTYVSRVIASVTGPGVAYVTFDAHRDGDFTPYILRTGDFGETWTGLTDGLPSGSVNVIREHPGHPDLLFAGTEHGLFASTDRGRHWVRVGADLPTTLYDDLIIHPTANALIVATHGRSLWILDDLTPLTEWAGGERPALFTLRPAMLKQYWKDTSYRGQAAYAGENPPAGAAIGFYAPDGTERASVLIQDSTGQTVRTLDLTVAPDALQQTLWDLRHRPPRRSAPRTTASPPDSTTPLPHPIGPRGPLVSPGRYRVTLTMGDWTQTEDLVVRGDTLLDLTDDDYRRRERFLLRIRDALDALPSPADTVRIPDATKKELRRIRTGLGRLFGTFTGSGARQGSLYPPTSTQQAQWEALRDAVQRLPDAREDR